MCIDKLTTRHLCSVVALVIMVGVLAALAPREVVAVVRAGTEPGKITVGVALEGQPEQQQVLHIRSVD